MADQFDAAYLEGSPPWNIGRAQPELVKLAEAGRITGRVIDLGCGTGENALYIATLGLDVVGVDGAPEAIRQARVKANTHGISMKFDVADVLDLGDYRESFDTATNWACFMCSMTRTVLVINAAYAEYSARVDIFLLCFSERQPGDWGPRRVTQREIRETFSDGWHVESIDEAHLETNLDDAPQVDAWLTALTRL